MQIELCQAENVDINVKYCTPCKLAISPIIKITPQKWLGKFKLNKTENPFSLQDDEWKWFDKTDIKDPWWQPQSDPQEEP